MDAQEAHGTMTTIIIIFPPHKQVVAQQGRVRTARMTLPHYTAETPMFMPVGTQGTVKGLTAEQLQDLDCHVILGNTYHLENRPGAGVVARMGGLHGFSNWPRGMLTDSGGFQVCGGVFVCVCVISGEREMWVVEDVWGCVGNGEWRHDNTMCVHI